MKKTLLLLLTLLLSTLGFGQQVNIGDILCTDGSTVSPADYLSSGRTAWGIVFFVDDNGQHGWAVSLQNQSASIEWSSSNYYGYDIQDLVNFENARSAMHDLNGRQNTGVIRNTSGSNNFPAAWSMDYDNGWFLPSAGQLRYLFSYFPEMNASLQVVGGSLFPLEGQYYWWSSTEMSAYHAYDMNNGGSIGDYVKDNHVNYPANGIAVRQIRDFDIPIPVLSTYHIGDLITNDDGSQGILFYVSPDQTEGWMVALNDASTSVSWGDGDVPELDNQTYLPPFGMLLNETDGYANTGTIKNHQIGMNTAANIVDYEHGWYLPTAGQLSKLYGALPFIEGLLHAHGDILAQDEYWSSSEANADEAFVVSFKPSANVRAGGFIRSNKSQNYHVRAVRNLIPLSLPSVGEIVTPESICENESLTLLVPETQSATSEGWQISQTMDFENPIPYEGQPLDSSYDGWFLRYFAANENSTVYSNIVSITIWPTYDTSFSVMACTHYVWNGIDYDESGDYDQSLTSIHGCDSIVTMQLTIADVVTNEWSQQTCDDSFEWNGITYTATGNYEQTFTSVDGCDSIVTLHLTFKQTMEVEADTMACGSLIWAGQEYTQSGNYDHMFVTTDGCDSLVHLHLTVKSFPEAVGAIEGQTEVYVSTDLFIGHYYYSIDYVGFANRYEWELDGADWPMDTTGLQCALWVTSPGDVTLRVKAWNSCGYTERETLIHAGFFNLPDDTAFPVALYPNPAHDKVFIETEGSMKVRLFNLLGQCLLEEDGNDRVVWELTHWAPAIYLVEVTTQQGRCILKLDVMQ